VIRDRLFPFPVVLVLLLLVLLLVVGCSFSSTLDTPSPLGYDVRHV
jgi:hypothetical protein